MKREDIVASFDKIIPDKAAERRMLDKILSHSGNKKKIAFNYIRAIPALGLAIVIAGGLLAYNATMGRKSTPAPEHAIGDTDGSREDAAMPLLNQFELDGKHYIALSDDLRAEFGFPGKIIESHIGEKITVIKDSADKSLIGCEVYRYEPAGSEAVVAVRKDGEYILFRFFAFESYLNNQDEDAIEYLKIYGINKADDIEKVQFIVYSEQSKLEGKIDIRGELTDRNNISRFYGYFSALKNSSDKYFERLFNYRPGDGLNEGVKTDTTGQVNPVAPEVPALPEPGDSPISPVAPDAPDRSQVSPVDPNGSVSSLNDTGYAEDMPLEVNVRMPAQNSTGRTYDRTSTGTGVAVAGSTGAAVPGTEPTEGIGGNALADPVAIRIYNQSGVYFETMYYRNIGFISRYEINDEFAAFIEGFVR